MTGQDVAHYTGANLEQRWRYAEFIASAGDLVPKGLRENNAPSAGKVLLVMEHATMLGLHPIVGINNINIIEGKVSVPPALMSALVRKAGHKLRVSVSGTVEKGDLQATATLVRSDDPDHEFTATWTPSRAQRAGLCTYLDEAGVWSVRARSERGKALPWETYTEALCKARAISEVVMEGATDVMMGAVYTPEELGAEIDDLGVVVATPQDDAATSQGDPWSQPATPATPAVSVAPSDNSRDWAAEIAAIATSEEARLFYKVARDAGALNTVIMIGDEQVRTDNAITARGVELLDAERKSSGKTSDDGIVEGEIVDEQAATVEPVEGGES